MRARGYGYLLLGADERVLLGTGDVQGVGPDDVRAGALDGAERLGRSRLAGNLHERMELLLRALAHIDEGRLAEVVGHLHELLDLVGWSRGRGALGRNEPSEEGRLGRWARQE